MQNPTERPPAFAVGGRVRVRPGTPSDYPDIPMGGWAGMIREVQHDTAPLLYLVEFDRRTLAQIHPVYRKRCARDGFFGTQMWLGEDAIEPDTGAPVTIEQPTRLESRPLDTTDPDDYIRALLGLTSDDPIRGQGGHHFPQFEEHFRMVTEARTQAVLGTMYPAIANWVEQHGTIEIGRVGETGVTARLRTRGGVVFEGTGPRTLADALNALDAVLRCDFGEISFPVVPDRSWLTTTVVALAQQIDTSGDFSAMPILADALQDAGCDNEEVLGHCRGPGPHVRGCWVVVLVLGKE
jgi:hypothetical protein